MSGICLADQVTVTYITYFHGFHAVVSITSGPVRQQVVLKHSLNLILGDWTPVDFSGTLIDEPGRQVDRCNRCI